MSTAPYRTIATPFATRAQRAYAPRYATLEGAWCDMGEGVVIDATGATVAFHARHAGILERFPHLIGAEA